VKNCIVGCIPSCGSTIRSSGQLEDGSGTGTCRRGPPHDDAPRHVKLGLNADDAKPRMNEISMQGWIEIGTLQSADIGCTSNTCSQSSFVVQAYLFLVSTSSMQRCNRCFIRLTSSSWQSNPSPTAAPSLNSC
jgi:hypothetical protein